MKKHADEATEAKRHIVFSGPGDTEWLAAYGMVSVFHGHVDHVLKMMIKNLSGKSWQEARVYTAR